ncbi:MAG: ABC transporter permease [Ferruginibacter sp.]|nr:ABC transporter permease [Bacteroidota bacterium]MBX2919293.1 ABC transporter permease [Ferruginibacter sp.]MCB0708221.1 ABC transporter permease [Chitinophagaceae bacterium]MCC7378240.1 ABC transporter permease [Chitinophagaceae bacterium]
MNKILLILKREYLTRVKKKSFVFTTILFPALYMALIFGTGYLSSSVQKMNIAIVDSSGYFGDSLLAKINANDSTILFTPVKDTSIKSHFRKAGYDGYIIIPPIDWQTGRKNIKFITDKTHGAGTESMIENKLNIIWSEVVNEKLGIDNEKKTVLNTSNISIKEENQENKNANSAVSSTIGYVCGFLIYFILLIYGSQVMMGVMEEKTNRIAEVVVSSVKPFQLMLGKIIGISLVALTQFFIWIACIFLVYTVGKMMGSESAVASAIVAGIQKSFASVNLPLILGCFAFYFMGGFFFYSSLYAAIGSAINEDVREAQSLSFPITLLIIFAIFMMSVAIRDPNGPIAVWGSIIPFTSPIVMMARLPFGVPGTVPAWQLILSMALLVIGFLCTTWLAAKIYRTGILMYGKKPTWKEMLKWALRK